MPKFRKKPVEIEAVQWLGRAGLSGGCPGWLKEAMQKVPTEAGGVMRFGDDIHIGTLEGVMIARPEDWIIRGVKGELYPCRDDIFRMTYEAVDAA
jgi:hypothetical protein